MHICGFGLWSSASLPRLWWWSWTLWLSLRDRFAVPGSEARHEHGKPGRVQVEVDENLISTLLGSQSGCHVRGCRWACGLDAAMDSRAGSGTCDWLPQVLGDRRPGEVRPEPDKAAAPPSAFSQTCRY